MRAFISRAGQLREHLLAYALIAPSMAIFAVFFIYPVVHTVFLSFFEWNLVSPPKPVGLSHYVELAGSEVFGQVLLNTLVYSCATVAATMVGGLALALMVNRRGGLSRLIQGCVFTSYIVSWVGVSLLWLWLLDADFGLVNHVASLLGLDKMDWLGDPDIALWALVGVSVWKIVGYDMVIYLAGLQSIPDDLYEAAALDGAGPRARFRHITVPLLVPTSLFLLVTSVVMTFQGFDVVRVMTQGGPVDSTTIYVYYVYQQAFEFFRVGYASAAVVVFFVLIMAVTLVQFRLFDREAS